MQIISLIDNFRLKEHPTLAVEHGLSIAILLEGQSILFDSGESDAFLRNAHSLDVAIASIDAAVFSHHHYDHCGGWAAFINENQSAPLYLRSAPDGNCTIRILGIIKRDVGGDTSLFQQHAERFHFIDQFTEVLPNVFIITEISRRHPLPKGNRYLLLEHNRKRQLDPFDHELILVIKENGRLVVFSGCSHRGILNMLDSVVECFPDIPIEAVFGGYHLIGMPLFNNLAGSPQDIADLGKALLQYPVNHYFTGHCTGQKAFRLLKPIMGDRLKYFATGCRIEMNS